MEHRLSYWSIESLMGRTLAQLLPLVLAAGKRRYDRKQSGYGGQTKPVFHKKVRLGTMCADLPRRNPPWSSWPLFYGTVSGERLRKCALDGFTALSRHPAAGWRVE